MIIVRIYEGLGNQLFQYAYARAVSFATGQKVFLDVRETGSLERDRGKTLRKSELHNFRTALPICTNVEHFYPYLNASEDLLKAMEKLSGTGFLPFKYFEEKSPVYNERLLNLKGNWYLQGWFQDSRYFFKYSEELRKELRPRKKIKISKKLKDILRTKHTVSIHIRRSDYIRTVNTLPVQYYYNAMNHMKEFVRQPFWVVFSDEPEWVKRNIDFGRECFFLSEKETLQDYEELIVMSCCQNHIIANSTFSWWGAWLGQNADKVVIGPERWLMKVRDFDYGEDILLKEWIKEPVE